MKFEATQGFFLWNFPSQFGGFIMDKISIWEICGGLFAFLVGAAFHYAFEWANYYRGVAWLFAVNESVWEHLKLAFWPLFLFAIPEYYALRKESKNFFFAKSSAFIIAPATIMVVFYTYTYFTRNNILFLDISSFALGIIFAQITADHILHTRYKGPIIENISIAVIGLIMTIFVLFTYFPPNFTLFIDQIVNYGGILSPEDYGLTIRLNCDIASKNQTTLINIKKYLPD